MKNNYSKEHSDYLKRIKRKNITVSAIRWFILLAFFGLWELLAQTGAIDAFITSCPSRIATTLFSLARDGELMPHVWVTLWETIVSFLLATVLGVFIAVLLWWSETARRVTEPFIVVLNALPKIALGPLIIIWVGAGAGAIIVMALLITLIITVINVLNGFLSIDKEKILLMRSMNATKLQTLTKLVLPANIPTIVSALKINVGMSWVGTIMGEYLVSKAGLGYLIVYGGQIFKLDLVMTSTVILCVLAGGMYFLVELLEKLIVKKMGFAEKEH